MNSQPLPTVTIAVHEKSCRGCELCVDICPTDVFSFNEKKRVCVVDHVEDCIACLSCAYICPAGAIQHSDYHIVKNYYRNIEDVKRVGRFL